MLTGVGMKSLMPKIGTVVTAFFYGNKYRAKVVSHGRKYPIVEFRLKNGSLLARRATIFENGQTPADGRHTGVFCQMLHPTANQPNPNH